MENKKYKKRLEVRREELPKTEPSLKEAYAKEDRVELIVGRSSIRKISDIYATILHIIMVIFAFVGIISILRPDLRQILFELVIEAIREIRSIQ